jgi:hypothetical protein
VLDNIFRKCVMVVGSSYLAAIVAATRRRRQKSISLLVVRLLAMRIRDFIGRIAICNNFFRVSLIFGKFML